MCTPMRVNMCGNLERNPEVVERGLKGEHMEVNEDLRY